MSGLQSVEWTCSCGIENDSDTALEDDGFKYTYYVECECGIVVYLELTEEAKGVE